MNSETDQPAKITVFRNGKKDLADKVAGTIEGAIDSEARISEPALPSGQIGRRFHLSVVLVLAALSILLLGRMPIYLFGLFDTLTNFRWQAVFFCVCMAVYQQYRGRRTWACVILALSAVAAIPLVSLYFPASQPAAGNSRLRVLTLNVLESNSNFASVAQLIRDTNADIVNLIEYSPKWESDLQDVLSNYPWHVGPVNGNIVYSKLPLKPFDFHHWYFGAVKYLSAAATLEVDGQPVLIVTAHPTSPTSLPRLLERDAQIGLLAAPVSHLPQWYHVVMVGDFNATTSCRCIRSMMATTGFRDSRQGFGVQSSWPTFFWPLAICIDHAFVSGGVHIHERKTGPNVGSDHLPVILELSFGEFPVLQPNHVMPPVSLSDR